MTDTTTYYGRFVTKFSQSLDESLLEQQIKKIIDDAAQYHSDQLDEMQKSFKKSLSSNLNAIKKQIKKINDELTVLKARSPKLKKMGLIDENEQKERIKVKMKKLGYKIND